MAITIALVRSTPNWLRYLVTITGGEPISANITTTGGPTPDLLTDSLQGPIKKLAKVITDGFAQFPAGAQTQARARALWLSDWSGADPGNENTTTARCRIAMTGGNVNANAQVDADVVAGNPVLVVSGAHDGAGSVFFLDVEVPQAIGT